MAQRKDAQKKTSPISPLSGIAYLGLPAAWAPPALPGQARAVRAEIRELTESGLVRLLWPAIGETDGTEEVAA